MTLGKRASGVLLHVTSLPSRGCIGDLGAWAFKFADLLAEAGQRYWQVLPLNPTGPGNSPYNPRSLFAGNPLLLSPGAKTGRRPSSPPEGFQGSGGGAAVDYGRAAALKDELIRKEFERLTPETTKSLRAFSDANSSWLEDYALFAALSDSNGTPWYLWPKELRERHPVALSEQRSRLADRMERERCAQHLFASQWSSLREYCRERGMALIGDLPFYPALDSCDVWVHRELFKLDPEGRPVFVSGVPPDYFSETGQLWGNPVYDWEELKETNFSWWRDRIGRNLELFDLLRIDHFRGLVAYWEILAGEGSAVNGRWVDAPADEFLTSVRSAFPAMPLIAENLGVITPEVRRTMDRFGLPGMNVLVFAFDGSPENPYLPRNHLRNSVTYTTTHDTNTALGWFEKETDSRQREALLGCVGGGLTKENVSWKLIELAMGSRSDLAIVPLQDVLALGSEARMNRPSFSEGNWEWRATDEQLSAGSLRRLGKLGASFGRSS